MNPKQIYNTYLTKTVNKYPFGHQSSKALKTYIDGKDTPKSKKKPTNLTKTKSVQDLKFINNSQYKTHYKTYLGIPYFMKNGVDHFLANNGS